MDQIRILFISRAFPPIVGGIENQNHELSVWLPRFSHTRTIANTHGKLALPFFLPWILLKLVFILPQYDVLLLGDGVLAIAGAWAKLIHPRKKIICITHGLDLTFDNSIYQNFWVKKFIPTCDKLIAVGNQTIMAGVSRGISKDKFVFIPNGVDLDKFGNKDIPRDRLWEIIGEQHKNHKIILSCGRLAKRKGVAWFIREVLPKLAKDISYVVAGTGPDQENIEQAFKDTGLSDRVILLGYVSDDTRNILLNTCDLFIQPNITVKGDMEGFGISVLEAGASGIPVLASATEGLLDAIKDGENGIHADPANVKDWQEKIELMLGDGFDSNAFGEKARKHIAANNSWEVIAKRYITEIDKVSS